MDDETGTAPFLLRNARWGVGAREVCDVLVTASDAVPIASVPATRVPAIDVAGAHVVAGIHDHHLHLFATAADRESVSARPPLTRDGFVARLRAAEASADGWVRAVGYHESVAGDLDAHTLDRVRADVPVRVQHRSGMLWTVNSAGLRRLSLGAHAVPSGVEVIDGAPTGRLWRADGLLRERIASRPPSLRALAAELAAMGVTAVTDATPDLDDDALAALERAVRSGEIRQDIVLLGAPLGWEPPPDLPGVRPGPYKIVLDENDLPAFDELTERIRIARAHDRAVAVHCVSIVALAMLLAAVDAAGGARGGDRIEHASIVDPRSVAELSRRGIAVVTQPGFIADRGDSYLADVPAADIPSLYPIRSLLAAGVDVSLSSDAPYGPLDPWVWAQAAVARRAPSGRIVSAEERIGLDRAIELLRLRPGGASLVVLDADPRTLIRHPHGTPALATYLHGRIVHGRMPDNASDIT